MEKITLSRDTFINTIASLLKAAGLNEELAYDISVETFYDLAEEDFVYKGNILLFAKALTHYRNTVLKQKWAKMPERGSKDWDALVILVSSLESFIKENYKSIREGYKDIVKGIFEINPKLKDKFIYGYLISMSEDIIAYLVMLKEIQNDQNKEITEKLIELYTEHFVSQTGMPYIPTINSKLAFVRMGNYCKTNNITPNILIEGAFDFLQYKQGIPKPENILNEKFLIGIGQYKSLHKEPVKHKINLKELKDKKW